MWINCRKSRPANDLILAIAFKQQIDIVLIQELQIRVNFDKKITKKYNI